MDFNHFFCLFFFLPENTFLPKCCTQTRQVKKEKILIRIWVAGSGPLIFAYFLLSLHCNKKLFKTPRAYFLVYILQFATAINPSILKNLIPSVHQSIQAQGELFLTFSFVTLILALPPK